MYIDKYIDILYIATYCTDVDTYIHNDTRMYFILMFT